MTTNHATSELTGVPKATSERGAQPSLTREERRSLALHAAIAVRLRDRPDAVLARARRTLERMRHAAPHAAVLLNEWEAVLTGPLAVVLEMLADPTPHARELRHVTPFAGVLTARERAEVYRTFARSERSR